MELRFWKWNLIRMVFKLFLLTEITLVRPEEVVSVQGVNTTRPANLSCYQCLDNFHRKTLNPYTDCQRNPTRLHQRKCGFSDRYCMVERVEWNGMLLSMERGCTDLCYWGCRYEGFGITKLRCTSCCNHAAGCNTDNSASARHGWQFMIFLIAMKAVLYSQFSTT